MSFHLFDKERRRFKRAVLRTDMIFMLASLKGEVEGHILNISQGGAAFTSEVEVPVATEITVTFHFVLDADRDIAVVAKAQVRYCVMEGDYKRYQVGVEFTEICAADKDLIGTYVDFTLKNGT